MFERRRLFVVAVLVLLAICFAASGAEYTGEAPLVFEQVDYNLNGEIVIDSAWGSVLLTYEGSQEILYFNLTVDGVWVVQNMPIFSHEGVGASQALGFNYEMEIDDGTPVSQVQYGYSLTDDVIDAMPAAVDTAPVIDRDVAFFSGAGAFEQPNQRLVPEGGDSEPAPSPSPDSPPTEKTMDRPPTSTAQAPSTSTTTPPTGPMPPRPMIDEAQRQGSRVEDFARHDRWLPTQDCPPYMCVPAAVSDSLRFLNEKYGLGIDLSLVSIERLADEMGWKETTGCKYTGENAWNTLKDKYLKKVGIPIVTSVIFDPDRAMLEIRKGQDVELQSTSQGGSAHTAKIFAIARLANGKYIIWVSHDTDQLHDDPNDRDIRIEPVIHVPPTAPGPDLFGGAWFFNTSLCNFVVECPDQQTQPPATPGPTPPPATPPTTPPPSTPPPPQSPSLTPGTSPPPTTPPTPPPSTTPPETTPPPSTPPATPPQTTPPGTTPPTTPPGSSPPPGTPPGTTAPPEQQGSDLAIEIRRASCLCPIRTPGSPPKCAVHVIAIVHSIGTETVWGKYVVELSSEWGSSQRIIYGDLNPQPTLMADLGFTIPNHLMPCPIEATVTVDSQNEIEECNELNNTVRVVICCEIVSEGAEEEFVPDDD